MEKARLIALIVISGLSYLLFLVQQGSVLFVCCRKCESADSALIASQYNCKAFGFILRGIVVLIARAFTLFFPLLVWIYQPSEIEDERTFAVMRVAMAINLVHMLPDLVERTTLAWEPMAKLNMIMRRVFAALMPLLVLTLYVFVTVVLLLYMLGLQQKDNEASYFGLGNSLRYVFQLIFADLHPNDFETNDTVLFTLLWILYSFASVTIVLLLMNFIIAVMVEVVMRPDVNGYDEYARKARVVMDHSDMVYMPEVEEWRYHLQAVLKIGELGRIGGGK